MFFFGVILSDNFFVIYNEGMFDIFFLSFESICLLSNIIIVFIRVLNILWSCFFSIMNFKKKICVELGSVLFYCICVENKLFFCKVFVCDLSYFIDVINLKVLNKRILYFKL